MAEEWLVGQATGAGTRTGRGLDAKRLRQAARRMLALVDGDLAARHQAILLGRETRTAQAETYLLLHDNGDGSYTGRFRIPELHGHLLARPWTGSPPPRRLSRDRAAGEARRLACSAGLVPTVLDSASMPLDLGRTRRLHTRTQRRALALTHDTCAITGCQRPFAWCEIHHHRLPWSEDFIRGFRLRALAHERRCRVTLPVTLVSDHHVMRGSAMTEYVVMFPADDEEAGRQPRRLIVRPPSTSTSSSAGSSRSGVAP